MIKLSASTLVGPVDRHARVGVLELLDLRPKEVTEVILQPLGLERDLAFDLRGVDLRVINVSSRNITSNVRLRNGTGSG